MSEFGQSLRLLHGRRDVGLVNSGDGFIQDDNPHDVDGDGDTQQQTPDAKQMFADRQDGKHNDGV